MTVMGLPHEPTGETLHTNSSGHATITAQWSQPGTYTVSVGNGLVAWQTHVVVQTSQNSSTASTPAFAGQNVQREVGTQAPQAIPNGFHSPADQHLTFSNHTYHRVEGFVGTLNGHSFILDFYQDDPVGLFVGVQYNGQPVYFGTGAGSVFDVLNFTSNMVVLGSPAAGNYMALNLVTGQPLYQFSQVVPLKGYHGLTAPADILGLPNTQYPVAIPYDGGQ